MTQIRCSRVETCQLSERACATRFVLASHLTRRVRPDGLVSWTPRELAHYSVCHQCPDGYERSLRLRIDPEIERPTPFDEIRVMETRADWGNVQHRLRRAHADRGRDEARQRADVADLVPVDASPERFIVAAERRDRWRSIARGIVQKSETFGTEHNEDVAKAERDDYTMSLALDGYATGAGRCGWAKEAVRSRKGRAKRIRQIAAVIAAGTVGAGELWRRRRVRIADKDVYFADPRRAERGRTLMVARAVGYPIARADGRAYRT